MKLKSPATIIWVSLFVGWCTDFLFWDKVTGISFPIFVLIALGAGFFLAYREGIKPSRNTLWLLIPIAFFSVMTIFRLEPLTGVLNVVAVLLLMGMFAHSFLGGKWWLYTLAEYIKGAFSVGLDALSRQIAILTKQPKFEDTPETRKKDWRTFWGVLRGILLAFPIILIFASLLSQADPIFEESIQDFLDLLNIENLPEYIWRTIVICFAAYILSGVYLHALYKDHDEKVGTEEKPLVPRFLGFTETSIILGSVNILFLVFVVIQFQYFFGGEANISYNGYTYAEYARRGFGELVTVAVFSILLFMGLASISKRETPTQGKVYSGLGIVLVALVSVMLYSSFQRLRLYELVYGFTRLRTYTHVFIFWLGLLLAAVVVLELFRKQRHFALAMLAAGLGFVATLNILNVDGFIVRQNVARAQSEGELDIAYLASLSEDAVPLLFRFYRTEKDLTEELTGVIACHAALNNDYDYANHPYSNFPWQSFHFSRYNANQDLQYWRSRITEDFKPYYSSEGESLYGSYVLVDGKKVKCHSSYFGWD